MCSKARECWDAGSAQMHVHGCMRLAERQRCRTGVNALPSMAGAS